MFRRPLLVTLLFCSFAHSHAQSLDGRSDFVFNAVVESKSASIDSDPVLYVRVGDFWVPVVVQESTRLRSADGKALTIDEIAVGSTVEVRADWTDAGFVAETLTTTPSEVVSAVGVVESAEADRIVVAGVTFKLDDKTESGSSQIVPGQLVAVRGSVASDGLLVASQVDSHQAVRLYGKIESIDAAAKTLKVAGKTVQVTAGARASRSRSGAARKRSGSFGSESL